jgi:hypothetical protein
MEAKIASCNFTKYIKRGPNRWQHCPVVRGKTGRVKQDLVLVDGRIEQHPEGTTRSTGAKAEGAIGGHWAKTRPPRNWRGSGMSPQSEPARSA